jgi:hypothetical protein
MHLRMRIERKKRKTTANKVVILINISSFYKIIVCLFVLRKQTAKNSQADYLIY